MTDAVLLTCHGTVSDLADVPAFLSNVRRGRPAPPELITEIQHRLEHIGGSPLMRISGEQAAALESRLGVPCRVAGRLWGPYPGEVLAVLAREGAARVISLPLAAQSVHVYHQAVEEAAKALPGLAIVPVAPWGEEPALIDALRETVEEGLVRADATSRPPAATAIVLTAHSLPERIIASGDPYESQFRAMAGRVAEAVAHLGHPVSIAFQSQGATSDAWLGPDLPTAFRAAREAGAEAVMVAPIGFLAEHVETLYDLDVDAPRMASAAGVAYARAPAACARPRLIDALEAVARRALSP
jgi:ferrochelatase